VSRQAFVALLVALLSVGMGLRTDSQPTLSESARTIHFDNGTVRVGVDKRWGGAIRELWFGGADLVNHDDGGQPAVEPGRQGRRPLPGRVERARGRDLALVRPRAPPGFEGALPRELRGRPESRGRAPDFGFHPTLNADAFAPGPHDLSIVLRDGAGNRQTLGPRRVAFE